MRRTSEGSNLRTASSAVYVVLRFTAPNGTRAQLQSRQCLRLRCRTRILKCEGSSLGKRPLIMASPRRLAGMFVVSVFKAVTFSLQFSHAWSPSYSTVIRSTNSVSNTVTALPSGPASHRSMSSRIAPISRIVLSETAVSMSTVTTCSSATSGGFCSNAVKTGGTARPSVLGLPNAISTAAAPP